MKREYIFNLKELTIVNVVRLVTICVILCTPKYSMGQTIIDDSFLIQDLLEEGYRVQCKITDGEMSPTFQLGDEIIVSSVDDKKVLKKKDIVLVNVNNRYVCRRILKIKNGVVSLKGDSQKKKDVVECDTSEIIAIVQVKEVPRKPISVDSNNLPKGNASFVRSTKNVLKEHVVDEEMVDLNKGYFIIDTTDSIANLSNCRNISLDHTFYLLMGGDDFSLDQLVKSIVNWEGVDSKTALIRAKRMIEEWYSIGAIQLNKVINVGSLAEGLEEIIWEEVREKRPYNFQSELYHKFDDGSAIFIITEPTEEATLEDIEKVFSGLEHKVFTHKKELGYDGWLKDAVICVNNFDDSQKDVIKDKLFTLLYGTTYKAEFTPIYSLPAIRPFNEDLKLNLQVSATELKSWFFDNKESFKDDKGNVNTLDFWFDGSKNQEILQSEESGFVVWIVNKENDNEVFRVNARRFALDTDLVLGAFEKNGKVAIIGRQRSVPTTILPPMRPETIMMLASTKENQLEQSYERNHFFAGKLPDGNDYAPILLSDELWHTEYGSLLNVADQMLKSWSMNGLVEYDKFNYTKPLNYPFFEGSVKDLHTSNLTFNWNTSGAGYEVLSSQQFPYNIYALNRTGALPVSYIPGEGGDVEVNDSVFLAEESAYDYFSSLCNPELIKVVQYAALYQIFVNYNIQINHYKPYEERIAAAKRTRLKDLTIDSTLGFSLPDYVQEHIKTQATSISNSGNGYLPIKNNFDSTLHLVIDSLMHETDRLDFYDKIFSALNGESSHLGNVKKDINKAIKRLEFEQKNDVYAKLIGRNHKRMVIDSIAERILNPRMIKYNIHSLNERNKVVKKVKAKLSSANSLQLMFSGIYDIDQYIEKSLTENDWPKESEILFDIIAKECIQQKSNLVLYGSVKEIVDKQKIMRDYVDLNKRSFSEWIKCPTVVISNSTGIYEGGTGGHNLRASITPIKIDNTLKAGQFKVVTVNGQKSIMVAASDAKNVTPDLLRQVERTKMSGLQRFGKESHIVRSRDKVIPIDALKSSVKAGIKRFEISRTRLSEIDEMLRDIKTSLSTGNKGAQQFEIRGLSESEIEATLADIRGLQIEVISESEALARVTIPEEPRVVGVKKYAIDRAKITEIDDMLRDINISMSKSPETSKQFIIEGLTENEVRIIFEDGSSCIADKGATMNLNMDLFDFDNIMVESLSGSETTTRVTIPVKAKSIGMKKASMVYDVPTEKVSTFIKTLKEIFPKMKERWNNFPFMRQLKKNNISEDEIREIFMYETAKIIQQLKQEFYVEYISEEAA